MTELLVLQHDRLAGPSMFTSVLDQRTGLVPWRLVEVAGAGDLPDDLSGAAGLVVLGGTMSVTTPDTHDWITPELALLRAAVDEELPVFGVCLGAQLLAAALGGEVTRRQQPQVGYLPLRRTEEASGDLVFGGWQDGATMLFVHEDEVSTLPADAEPMLTGGDGMAAWRCGSARAVQFHPETDANQLDEWVADDALTPMLDAAGVDRDALTDEANRRSRFSVPIGRALLGRFIDGMIRPRLDD